MKDVATQHLDRQRASVRDKSRFEIWRSIVLGMYHDANALLAALTSQHCEISPETEQIMRGKYFALTPEMTVLNLTTVSPRQLGFTRNAQYGNIFAQGTVQGLLACPIEMPAQLRRQYGNQPEGQILRVVSRSKIPDPQGRPRIFTLTQYAKTPYLALCTAGSDTCFGLDDLFVWICPSK